MSRSKTTAPASDKSPAPKRRSRIPGLIAIGAALLAVALYVRNSPWARDRQLNAMSSRSLGLYALERPRDPLVQQYLGTRLFAEGDLQGALTAFSKATTLDPKSADAHLGLGMALMQAQQPYAAERALVKAAELRPKDIRAYFLLADIYGRYRNTTSSIPPLEKVTQLDPQNAPAWHQLGLAFGDLNRYDESLLALEKAVRINNRRSEYLRDLGQVQMHFGRSAEARQSLERAKDLDPQDAGTLMLLARLEMGSARPGGSTGSADSRLVTAERYLTEALRLDPRYAPAYRELGAVKVRMRQFPQAVAALRKAVKLDATDGQAIFQLGQALLQSGNQKEGDYYIRGFQELTNARRSTRNLEDRIHQDPKNPELRLRIARIYRRYAWTERAVNQYQLYLSMQPSDRAVQKELQRYVAELKRSDPSALRSAPVAGTQVPPAGAAPVLPTGGAP